MDLNVACCLCVRDCSSFLPNIFINLNRLGSLFKTFYVIFIFDNCIDNTQILLEEYKKESNFEVIIINNVGNDSPYRPVRISNSRNKGLDIIYNKLENINFHFMIDADDVNINLWNTNLIKDYLETNNWDSLSFNRDDYYDIWALLYDNYKVHCWAYGTYKNGIVDYACKENINNIMVVEEMKKDISNKLKYIDGDLFECYSAFNGFAIYRTPIFKNIEYDAWYSNIKLYFNNEDEYQTLSYFRNLLNIELELYDSLIQCEHINYHLSAIKNNNAKIRISKKNLFL
jgi:hypothetical protein